jgi:methyl-accepting chemotaxis protein
MAKLKLFPKLLMSAFWINFWFLMFFLFWIIPNYRQTQYDAKMDELNRIVATSASMIHHYVDLVNTGELTLDEAQTSAISLLESARYDGENYFWINTLEPTMVMHPIQTKQVSPEWYSGRGLDKAVDDNGNKYIVELVQNIRLNDGEGFYEYQGIIPGVKDDQSVPIISHGIYIREWGWVVATAIPIEDIERQVSSFTRIIVVVISLIVSGTSFLAFLLTRSVTKPMAIITSRSQKLAVGNIQSDDSGKDKEQKIIQRSDELGEIERAFNNLMDYFREMASVAEQISRGDLTIDVTPKSEDDVLGNAFKLMVEQLRILLQNVAENANHLNAASMQLAQVSEQAGQVTNQISATIQQVAQGTAQQSTSVNETAGSIDQLVRAIDGVARGAQEQATAVTQSSQITAQMSVVIEQVAANARRSTQGANQAASTAKSGAGIVENNLNGMRIIKNKVSLSAGKVQEMGKRSDQIGMIVETIDDIASQTNLLALNAAIEAARAGEHGKGFAVVADEVRKLAERTASATKEVSKIIGEVQSSVIEAIEAMTESASEVDRGVDRAGAAGAALQEILNAVADVTNQVEEISAAAQEMQASSNELVAAMDSVSAIVEENTAATEEMSAGSSEVSQSIENIASVSEENSAAVEEVSASTEEMSAQVEEVSASAASLAEMAEALKAIVAQFKLAGSQDLTSNAITGSENESEISALHRQHQLSV